MNICDKFQLNDKLIWDVIHKLQCEPSEDLYQVGAIGLLNAIRKFDESRGFKFSTYASTCIRNEILRSFRGKKVSTINLTPNVIENTIDDAAEHYDMSVDLLSVIKDVVESKTSGIASDVFMKYYDDIAAGRIPARQLDMANELGISQRTVCRYLKKINNEIMRKWR